MINTEAVTNNASNKLKLIKLDSKYEFIGKNLDTAIRTVKEMLDNGSQFSQNDYLDCYMGLKANGDFLLLDDLSVKVSDIYDAKRDLTYMYATDVEGFKKIKCYSETDCIKIAGKLLSDYYQHALRFRNRQKAFTSKQLHDFLFMEVDCILFTGHTMMDCFFTPQAYIDYLLGQCQLPLTADTKEMLITANEQYISLAPLAYFYKQVLSNPNINILVKDPDFANLLRKVTNIYYWEADLQAQKLLQLINKMLTKEGKQND